MRLFCEIGRAAQVERYSAIREHWVSFTGYLFLYILTLLISIWFIPFYYLLVSQSWFASISKSIYLDPPWLSLHPTHHGDPVTFRASEHSLCLIRLSTMSTKNEVSKDITITIMLIIMELRWLMVTTEMKVKVISKERKSRWAIRVSFASFV